MKLLYVAPAHSIHTQRWLKAFVSRGHEVHLAAAPDDLARAAASDLEGVQVHPMTSFWPKAPLLGWSLELRRLLAALRPDILHGHYLTRYGWLAAAGFYRPLVLSAWGSDAYVDPVRSRLAARMTPWALRRADLVTADAVDLEQRLLELGARPSRTRVVQWGVDTRTFRPDSDDSSVRTRLRANGATGQPPLILCTRSLSPVYNQDVIVEAMAAVHAEVPEAHLVLKYGSADPPYHGRLLSLVGEAGLDRLVHFVGPTPYHELPGYYAAAAIFVSVASSDSTPVSLLEAMACGAVPVVSDLPALREWVTDGVNGFVVNGRDAAALAQAITRVLQDGDLRSRFSRLNREIILSRADHRSQMDEMEALYLRLAHPVKTLTP